uniref:type IX secretion system motor protein PorL/GldL n=1 Tax=Prevotella sp. TaxID=59823 RepID=UPI003FEF9B5B
MTEYSKYNFVYHLQKWMDSVPGQTFLNYAYSWGASIVILGALFKLTHLPGANFMLFAGMGTEAFVFFLSAFDRPFDKTQDGKELPTHIDGETEPEETEDDAEGAHVMVQGGAVAAAQSGETAEGFVAGGGAGIAAAVGTAVAAADLTANQQLAADMAEAQTSYLDELKKLTETLQKVSEQSARLTRDSEEMENLNRTLTGICKVYEMQLKGASQQIGTIDQINDQSRKMAQQIEQLNSIYARMIEAMTVNMNMKVKE